MQLSQTLDDIADLVRAKNAGPFWITLDVFLAERRRLRPRVRLAGRRPRGRRVALRAPTAEQVRVFPMRELRAIKISFPRPTVQGSFADRDMHSGQQHVPLAQLVVRLPSDRPAASPSR